MTKSVFTFLAVVVLMILVGCRTTSDKSDEIDVSVETGKRLFNRAVLGGAAGCATCHSLEPDIVLIGPSLAGVGSLVSERVEGLTAEEYLRQSILEPDANIASGFPAKVMPSTYQKNLSPDEIDSLVIYLLSIKKSD